jgi:signal transduction histidine kinase
VIGAVLALFVYAVMSKNVETAVAKPPLGVPTFYHAAKLSHLVVMLAVADVAVAMALRRRHPVLMLNLLLVGSGVVAFAWGQLAVQPSAPRSALDIFFLPVACVLFLVAATYERPAQAIRAVCAVLIALAADQVLLALGGAWAPQASNALIPVVPGLIIAWSVGYIVRQRRRYAIGLQTEAASKAVAEERLRIARELHDVVAHSMSVIAVQAGFGQYVIDSSPSDAREALGAIQATSRDALEEMRRMLGVLRQQDTAGGGSVATASSASATAATAATADGSAPGDPGAALVRPAARIPRAPLAPEPGIDDLDRLIERTSCTGVRVSLQRFGTPRSLPAGVGLSAYRIIQEALTNVVKHAGSDPRCVVCVRFGDEAIDIQVTDDGGLSASGAPSSGPPPAHADVVTMGSGHGITGMRERVHLCGGEFSAGPLPEGGFEVAAALPLHPVFADLGRRT